MPSTMRRTNGDNQLCTSSKRGRKARPIIEHPGPRLLKNGFIHVSRGAGPVSPALLRKLLSASPIHHPAGWAAGSRYAAIVERGLPYAPKRRGFVCSRSRRHLDPGGAHIPDRRDGPARLQPPGQRRSCGMRRCSRPIMFGAVVVTGRAAGNDSRRCAYHCGNRQRSIRLDGHKLKTMLPSLMLRRR